MGGIVSVCLWVSLGELWICFWELFLRAGRLHLPAQAPPSPLRWNGQMPDLSINNPSLRQVSEERLSGRSFFLQKHFSTFLPAVHFFSPQIFLHPDASVSYAHSRVRFLTHADTGGRKPPLCRLVCNPPRSSLTSQES